MTTSLTTRFETMDPFKVDTLIAVGLTLLVWFQLAMLTLMRPAFNNPELIKNIPRAGMGRGAGSADLWLPYLIAAGVFLALILRRELPWVSLLLSGGFALFYALSPFPPAFTMLGPMIAMYSVAAYAKERHAGLVALLIGGLLIASVAFTFTAGFRGGMEIISSFVMLAAAAFLGDTARSRREYIAEVEQRALLAEQAREEEMLRRVDEERILIAREVHDIVAHSLTIVAVQASAAETLIEDDPERARESLHNVRATSKEALGELRSMLEVLRTGSGDAPLAPSADLTTLEDLVEPVREANLGVDLNVEGDVTTLPAYASVSAYRIVQESLTNVVRHSGADSVVVSVLRTPRELTVEVTDNGHGMSAEETAIEQGHGIQGMGERVEALGGRFEAGNLADRAGFKIAATIPLPGGNQ